MAELKDVLVYILKNYPKEDHLSASRLAKMVYLSDWKSAISRHQQVTDIKWFFNHYGPYSDNIIELANSDSSFRTKRVRNMFGTPKLEISLSNQSCETHLSKEEREFIDFTIAATKDKDYNEFIKLVYSTYPVRASERYTSFDLPSLAEEYTAEKEKSHQA